MSLFATADFAGFNGDIKIMAQENWQIVKEIFADALRQSPEMRAEFLDSACGNKKNLRREVESLLASFDSAENFMETPAVGKITEKIAPESRQFNANQILGHYEIIGKIGAGGMGNVYLAQDLELQRRVALKILRESFSLDDKAKQRLLREARAVAKLDHPNICAIYEISETDDCSFIVMQYVSGETLADILTKERLSAEQSRNFALQIAAALEEAHAHHIIHRDIKPANIIVNNKGQLKVLDFGLAKIIEAETDEKATDRMSSSGAIMGTVPYMSPEQLRGETLDASTDIFSFGVLLYEMLGGISPFQQDSNAESISAILNDEPDLNLIPFELRPIVQKCLMKNKTARYQTVKDLIGDLRDLQIGGDLLPEAGKTASIPTSETVFPRETSPEYSSKRWFYFWKTSDSETKVAPPTMPIGKAKQTAQTREKTNYTIFFFASAVIFSLISTVIWLALKTGKTDDAHRFDDLRSSRLVSWNLTTGRSYNDYGVSHNGKMIAYSSSQETDLPETIFVKQIGEGEEIRITKDEWNNSNPIWSPDDQKIAFASNREKQTGIYAIPSLGGKAVLLKTIGTQAVLPRLWSKDGASIFYESQSNLFRLDLATKEIFQITDFAVQTGKNKYMSVSPNEDKLAFCEKTDGQMDIWIMPINGGKPVRITDDQNDEIRPRWHPDGERIIYTVLRNNHYQLNLAYLDGRPPTQITRGESESEIIDVSPDGTKIFYFSWKANSEVWGVKIETAEEFKVASGSESEFWADISPNGDAVVFQTNPTPDVFKFMAQSAVVVQSLNGQRVGESLKKGFNPRWLPDSRRVAFLRWQEAEKKYTLWTFDTISGEEKQISTNQVTTASLALFPYNRAQTKDFSWSSDSRRVIYISKEAGNRNILMTSPETGETVNVTHNKDVNTSFYCPIWLPDEERIAYLSEQKSVSGNDKPRWSVWLNEQGKSREIFSTQKNVRFLGWSAVSSEFFLETFDKKTENPSEVEIIGISASGKSRIVGSFKNVYASSMAFAADGKTFAFTARQNEKDDLFTVSTTGGEAKKITNNPDSGIYFGSPAFTPDGKTIFFDKQEEINIISMFENFK